MKMPYGFSLIELMVAIAIGLLLLLGLDTIFVSMNQTYNYRQQLSALQDNERMAVWILNTSIHNAGYFYIPVNTIPAPASTTFPANAPFSAAQYLVATTGVTCTNASGEVPAGVVNVVPVACTDTLSVRFVAAPVGSQYLQGCTGNTLTAGDLYTDVFSVSGGYLTCVETDNTALVTSPTVNLVANVYGMALLLGVDTTGNPTGNQSVTQYQKAANVASWNYVKTVKVTLQFNNPLKGQPGQPNTINLTQTFPYVLGL